jgi:hypothetical protein
MVLVIQPHISVQGAAFEFSEGNNKDKKKVCEGSCGGWVVQVVLLFAVVVTSASFRLGNKRPNIFSCSTSL